MAAPRIVVSDEGRFKDEESPKMDDSPTSKKPRTEGRFPLSQWELQPCNPEKFEFLQAEIAKRREKLNHMLFLRVTPTLPNLFINLASPVVDIPFHVFFLATLVGLTPASFITVRAGLALGELKSVKDLCDFKTLAVLFLIGFVIIVPAVMKRKQTYE